MIPVEMGDDHHIQFFDALFPEPVANIFRIILFADIYQDIDTA